jgi:hypothetical protein
MNLLRWFLDTLETSRKLAAKSREIGRLQQEEKAAA